MADSPSLLENIRTLAGQNKIQGLDCPDDDLSVDKISVDHLFDVYNIKVLSKGLVYTVKKGKTDVPSAGIESYIANEDKAANYLNNITEGMIARTLAYDVKTGTVVMEEMTGYESLQHRIIHLSKVDHGITCAIARQLASLHRGTAIYNINEEKYKEIQQMFGCGSMADLLVEHVFVTLVQVGYISPELDEKVKAVAGDVLSQPQVTAAVNAVREIFANKKECVIHGNINMTNIIVKDQQCIKLTGFGYAQMGPATYDLGSLVASYMTAYYVHLLTEEDNYSHRQTAYSMLDCVRKTVDTYLEQTSFSAADDQNKIQFINDLTAFTAIQLIARALNNSDCSECNLTSDVRVSILQSGHRLLNKYNVIDNVGRLLLIGLQLC